MNKIQRLVVNGCSYSANYSQGGGAEDLAQRLGLSSWHSLAHPGSSNKRIIRTCIKDSFQTDQPSLYVIGLTFISRTELPILQTQDTFEGSWLSVGNHAPNRKDYQENWNQSRVEQYIDLNLQAQVHSLPDRLEELMYQLLSLINDLNHRGHQALIFMQPADISGDDLQQARFEPLRSNKNIIGGLLWNSVLYQIESGARAVPGEEHIPANVRHVMPGEHKILNDFLENYIRTHQLL
jgi:hypothetical protein